MDKWGIHMAPVSSMDITTWLPVLPPLLTIAIAIWSKKIIPSLLIGLLAGSYFLHPTVTGGFETAVDQIVKTLTDKGNLQVLLFLYLFSGLIALIKKFVKRLVNF
jgi:Na+/H+ antiporter NhaC